MGRSHVENGEERLTKIIWSLVEEKDQNKDGEILLRSLERAAVNSHEEEIMAEDHIKST